MDMVVPSLGIRPPTVSRTAPRSAPESTPQAPPQDRVSLATRASTCKPSRKYRRVPAAWRNVSAAAVVGAISMMAGPVSAASLQSSANFIGPMPVASNLPSPPATLNPIVLHLDDLEKIGQDAAKIYHTATDARDVSIGGHDMQFHPVHITADPFAQGFGKVETDVWVAHVQSDKMRFSGDWKIETGFEAGLQYRHTLGHNKDNDLGNVLQPNYFGPHIEAYQRVTLPLDGAARADDAASRAAGHHVAPQAYTWDGNWLTRALSGGTHLFAQTEEGVEVHFAGDAVRPYARAMAGIERDIPFSDNRGIALRIGPELRATTSHGLRHTFYIEADYFF